MASVRKRGSSWYYRYRDENGRLVEKKGCSDKAMTHHLGREAEDRARLIRGGVLDPRESAYAAAETRPIVEHVADWHATLRAAGRSPDYADLARDRVLRVLATAKVARISQLTPSAVQIALGMVRRTRGRRGRER